MDGEFALHGAESHGFQARVALGRVLGLEGAGLGGIAAAAGLHPPLGGAALLGGGDRVAPSGVGSDGVSQYGASGFAAGPESPQLLPRAMTARVLAKLDV